jgi:PBP superfamily domain
MSTRALSGSCLAAIVLSAALVTGEGAYSLDASLPVYRPVEALSGHLKSVGSDTLGHETDAWARAFEKLYPDVKVDIEAVGSATAPTALVEGRAQFGPMSRPMTAGETAAFEAKYGYKVASFRVAVDALAVYVNKDNPIPCLTIPQLSGIFSSNRKAPGSADIRTWGDLGLTGEWARQPSPFTVVTRCRAPMSISARRRCTAAITSLMSSSSPARKQWCKRSRQTSSVSGIPASATKPRESAPCRSQATTARPATRRQPRRPFQESIRSHATSIFI